LSTPDAAPFNTREEFSAALVSLKAAAAAYYDGDGTLAMTDDEYDSLIDRVAATISKHPQLDDEGVLTTVAAGTSSGGTVKHPVSMLSLGKSKNIDDIRDYLDTKVAGQRTVTECKLDGMAVRVVYQSGSMTIAVTRGDGITGEDITRQLTNVVELPTVLANGRIDMEVRGEVYMTQKQFEVASAARVAVGKPEFANPRNATAGVIRNEQSAGTELSFACYDVSGSFVNDMDSYLDRMNIVSKLGIRPAVSLLPDVEPSGDAVKVISDIKERRSKLGFPIDGAVVKADSMHVREELGEVSRHPRWAIAFKYPAEEVTSTLRAIEVTIGRTGRLALTGIVDPVFVAGATVSKASLHNVSWLVATGMNVGSKVAVSRANDVIPRIVPLAGGAPVPAWVPPSVCPQCDGEWDKSTLLWRCTSPECSVVGRISYFASRDCMDIEGLGLEVADALVESGLVTTVADLYDLTVGSLANVQMGVTTTGQPRLVGETVAAKIVTEIDLSKTQPLNRVITSLGIRKTGRTMGRRLAAHFKSLSSLRSASITDITEVEGIAVDKATVIYDGLREMSPVIDRLVAAGVSTKVDTVPTVNVSVLPLAGKKVVVTGTVPGLTRTEAQEAVEALGGTATSSVSKTTDVVVVGEGAGSKADKAAQLGIPVMDAEKFAALYAAIK